MATTITGSLALPSTIIGYTLSTQDLAVPVHSLRLCKVLALMHNRMYIVNLVTHSSNAKMYATTLYMQHDQYTIYTCYTHFSFMA